MAHVPMMAIPHMLIAHVAVAHVAHVGPVAIARRAIGLLRRLLLHGRVGRIVMLALGTCGRDCEWCSSQHRGQQQGLAYSHDEPPNMVASGPQSS
jgi:hypothetical protein